MPCSRGRQEISPSQNSASPQWTAGTLSHFLACSKTLGLHSKRDTCVAVLLLIFSAMPQLPAGLSNMVALGSHPCSPKKAPSPYCAWGQGKPTLLSASRKSCTNSSITDAVYTPDSCQDSLFKQWSTVFNALFKMKEMRDRAVCLTDVLSSWEEQLNPQMYVGRQRSQALHWFLLHL